MEPAIIRGSLCKQCCRDKRLDTKSVHGAPRVRRTTADDLLHVDIIGAHLLDRCELHALSIVSRCAASQIRELPVSGLFFAIGHEPATKFLAGQLALHEDGYVVTLSAPYRRPAAVCKENTVVISGWFRYVSGVAGHYADLAG